jgi:Ctr copper transporter family
MSNHTSDDVFCTGMGRVMMMGFQGAYNGNSCVLFLFEGAVVDSATKYAFAVLGAFLMAMMNELLALLRKLYAARVRAWLERSDGDVSPLASMLADVPVALAYGVQMVNAYWMMLLVMTYEMFLFTAIISGLVVGHFLFARTLPRVLERRRSRASEYMPLVGKHGSDAHDNDEHGDHGHTPCCGGNSY